MAAGQYTKIGEVDTLGEQALDMLWVCVSKAVVLGLVKAVVQHTLVVIRARLQKWAAQLLSPKRLISVGSAVTTELTSSLRTSYTSSDSRRSCRAALS